MPYVVLAFLILLIFVQAWMVWKAAAEWRWYQIVAVVVTMILATLFAFPVAMTLKSRSAWHQVKEDQEKRLADLQREELQLRDEMEPITLGLARLSTEAGRRWRDLRLVSSDFNGAGKIVLMESKPAAAEGVPVEPAPAAADPATPPAVLIPESMVVYGFAEGRTPDAEQPIPTFYLGEFRVTASTSDQMTLTPTGELAPAQRQAIEGRQASSWAIYELLPLDGHDPFVAEGSLADDDNVLGRVDVDAVKRLLGKRVSDETLNAYVRDGGRSVADDEPLSRWLKIEFTANHSIIVDSPDKRGALDGGFFDGSGRAVDARLQHGTSPDDVAVKFAKGDQLIVQVEGANQLINEGVARLVDTYFLRPLNDYRFVLRRIQLRIDELTTRVTELQFERDVLQRAIDATVRMLTQYQTEKLKLEQDYTQTEIERKALQSYNTDLKAKRDAARAKVVELYRTNRSLVIELEQIQSAIQQQVNSLTSVR